MRINTTRSNIKIKMFNKLADLHKLCFPHKPWTAADFADLKKSGCEIVASENGFIVWRSVLDTAEIITIGVHPDARGNGIAMAMLGLLEHEVKKAGIKKIFLDVSAENTAAINLYKKCGFIENGRRPKYYDGIDAILMEKNI
ncbi:MAG: GNAT family N-acetyltransferase [Alphaproteobacteria bacterium]|nr:GNAT family N-acetyltransferase [Alphaproteobacteria bacterium]